MLILNIDCDSSLDNHIYNKYGYSFDLVKAHVQKSLDECKWRKVRNNYITNISVGQHAPHIFISVREGQERLFCTRLVDVHTHIHPTDMGWRLVYGSIEFDMDADLNTKLIKRTK